MNSDKAWKKSKIGWHKIFRILWLKSEGVANLMMVQATMVKMEIWVVEVLLVEAQENKEGGTKVGEEVKVEEIMMMKILDRLPIWIGTRVARSSQQ